MTDLFVITEAAWKAMSIPERNDLLGPAGQTAEEAAEGWEGHFQAMAELEAERRNERYFEEGSEAFQAARYAEDQEEFWRIGSY